MFCVYNYTHNKTIKSYIQPTNVEYQANVYDRFVLCKLKQIFSIIKDDIIEGTYQFPVDYNSAFCDLTITTPREVLKGIVKEKTEARNIYETAKKEGRQTFLTEESDSDRDIYKLSLGNVLKDDIIVVEYTYITEVVYSNGQYIFYIPSYVSPRYGGEHIPNPNHTVSAHVKICNNISNIKFSIPEVTISMDGNFIVGNFSSNIALDKDIEVTYNCQTNNNGLLYAFNTNGYNMGIISTMPKIKKNTENNNIVFILDCSGSMEGERIENSKKAIIYCLDKMLDTNNYFNLIRYGSNYDVYENKMLPCTSSNIKCAIQYCKSIRADMGGTETYEALQACLNICKCKTAILITDGDTSNNDLLHRLCKKFNALSILGIGSGINRANIKDMALFGSGMALFSQTNNDIVKNMDTIIKTILIPSIKNPVSNLHCNENLITKNAMIIDQPFLEYFITKNKILFYSVENDYLEQPILIDSISDIQIEPKYLGALVAKRIIQENVISDVLTKEKIIELSVDFNIITKYTSFIAVGNKIRCIEPQTSATKHNIQPIGCLGVKGTHGDLGFPEIQHYECLEGDSLSVGGIFAGDDDSDSESVSGLFDIDDVDNDDIDKNNISNSISGCGLFDNDDVDKNNISNSISGCGLFDNYISSNNSSNNSPNYYYYMLDRCFSSQDGYFFDIIKEISPVPQEICKDYQTLTIFILLWLKNNVTKDIFEHYYNIVMEKNPLWKIHF